MLGRAPGPLGRSLGTSSFLSSRGSWGFFSAFPAFLVFILPLSRISPSPTLSSSRSTSSDTLGCHTSGFHCSYLICLPWSLSLAAHYMRTLEFLPHPSFSVTAFPVTVAQSPEVSPRPVHHTASPPSLIHRDAAHPSSLPQVQLMTFLSVGSCQSLWLLRTGSSPGRAIFPSVPAVEISLPFSETFVPSLSAAALPGK